MMRLADYQVRLLLCRPTARVSDRSYWRCGCVATKIEPHAYAVMPCAGHAELLALIRRQELGHYDAPDERTFAIG